MLGLIDKLARQGSVPLPFYPDLFETDNPESGFVLTVYSPRFSTGYFPQRNRFTVLVETHSWKPYAKRVQATRNSIVGLAELAAERGTGWLAMTRVADAAAHRLGGSDVTLDYKSGWREPAAAGKTGAPAGDAEAPYIDFRGYAYTRTPSAISGSQATIYDPTTPQIWRVRYRSRIEPTLVVKASSLGYFIPRAYAQKIGPRLQQHGITVTPLPASLTSLALEQFRATRVAFSRQPFEGRMRAEIVGQWQPLERNTADPALFVPITQSLSRLIVALLEPQAPDSFAAWGFFNACFEQKEQLEPYVAEQIAREMSATHAALREEFERRLKDDAVFRADPVEHLEFFCRRHPSWDEQLNCYPIYRA